MPYRLTLAGHYAPRLGLALAAIYLALLATEVTLWWLQPTSVLRTMGRGLYVVRDGRVSLTPGFRTHVDDGYAHGDIAINSRIQGPEPRADGRDRVLLVGGFTSRSCRSRSPSEHVRGSLLAPRWPLQRSRRIGRGDHDRQGLGRRSLTRRRRIFTDLSAERRTPAQRPWLSRCSFPRRRFSGPASRGPMTAAR